MNTFRAEQWQAILNCVQEGVEFADAQGTIIYINPSFTRITGIEPEERVGKNIFELNPNGVLAKTLRLKRSFFGVRTTAPGKGGEGVANASPIYEGGQMIGAVITIYDLTEFLTVSKKLAESHTLLQGLIEKTGTAKYTFDDLMGESPEFIHCKAIAEKVADTASTVLLEGASGTGKELFAHAIHNASSRRDQPFISINCAAIPETLMESEFFGHEQGSFTGANKKKLGVFELANYGTLFLDEIGELPLNLQAKLLRAIQEKEVRPLGSVRTKKVDVRLVAATNRDLLDMCRTGRFREDLYYRLSVMTIKIPPLSQRLADLDVLVPHLIQKISKKAGKRIDGIKPEALAYLKEHRWPGNVRELENVLEYAILTTNQRKIGLSDIKPKLPLLSTHQPATEPSPVVGKLSLQEAEKQLIKEALLRHGQDVQGKKEAAKALGISLATLYNKMKKYQL